MEMIIKIIEETERPTLSPNELSDERRAIYIDAIIGCLRRQTLEKNKELVSKNLYLFQEKFDTAAMFFKLAFMDGRKLEKIAKLVIG
jgi:hypothetical protein